MFTNFKFNYLIFNIIVSRIGFELSLFNLEIIKFCDMLNVYKIENAIGNGSKRQETDQRAEDSRSPPMIHQQSLKFRTRK